VAAARRDALIELTLAAAVPTRPARGARRGRRAASPTTLPEPPPMPIQINEVLVQNAMNTIQSLEARVAQLERLLQVQGDKVTLQSGGSSVAVSASGVTITGRDITMSATGQATIKASGNLTLKGSKIQQN
jgi:hypothetical protein